MKTLSFLISVRPVAMVLMACSMSLAARAETRNDETAERNYPQAAQLLPVHAAGDYVERGTMRIQVAVKLGRPDQVMDDGTWIYHDQIAVETETRGSLLVRFDNGRVSELSLMTLAAKRGGKTTQKGWGMAAK